VRTTATPGRSGESSTSSHPWTKTSCLRSICRRSLLSAPKVDTKFDGAFYGRDFVHRNLRTVCQRKSTKYKQPHNCHR
jgi:hypothetical protein